MAALNATPGEVTATDDVSQNPANDARTAPTGSAYGNGVLLPSADLMPLFDYMQDCGECDASSIASNLFGRTFASVGGFGHQE